MSLHTVKKHIKDGGHQKTLKIAGVIFVVLVVVFLGKMFFHGGVGYGEGHMSYGKGGAMGMEMMAESADMAFSGKASLVRVSSPGGGIVPPYQPELLGESPEDRQIIKNGSLSLVVRQTESAMASVKDVAKRFEGFVDSVYIYETNNNKKTGSITLRVPSTDFEAVMSAIKALAFKVESENVNARDVTQQVVDLDIRLENMKAEEEQYREILKDAESIEDILNVTQRLNSARQRIESLQGQRDYFSRQVSMSTINVSMVSEADVKVFGVVWSPILVIKEAVRDGLQKIVNFVDEIIYFTFALPALLLWIGATLLLLWIAWKLIAGIIRKAFKHKKKK